MASSPSRNYRPLPFSLVIFLLAVVSIALLLPTALRPCAAQPAIITEDGPMEPPEAFYIDCGREKSTNDSQGRNWLSDKAFMTGFKEALPGDVKPRANFSDDVPEAILKTTRFFNDSDSSSELAVHCNIPVQKYNEYWIRFKFPFYNSKQLGSNVDSVFSVVLFQSVLIANVSYNNSLPTGTYDIVSLEIALLSPNTPLNFSFVVASGVGVHVSSIEILPLLRSENFSNYVLPFGNPELFGKVFRLERRINCGGPHVNGSLALPYAYDEDQFYDGSENSTVVTGKVPDERLSRVSAPRDIFKSHRVAAEGANLTYTIPVPSSLKFLINVYWDEWNPTLDNSGRQFKIFVDNLDATLEKDEQGQDGSVTTHNVFGTQLFSGGDRGRILIQFVPLEGNYQPIISGMEVYSIINLYGPTFAEDVAALREAAQDMRLAGYPLLGDPCSYPPNIIQCAPRQRNASNGSDGSGDRSLAIVVFNVTGIVGETPTPPASLGNLTDLEALILVSSSLRGPIPDSWQNLTKLRYLDLRNNDFSGPIPDWLADLPYIEQVHLGNNQFSGPVPTELVKRLQGNFTYLPSNVNLCGAQGLEPCLSPSLSMPAPPMPSDRGSRSKPSSPQPDPQVLPSSSRNSATTARNGSFKFTPVVAAATFLFLLSNFRGFTL